jgi:hypothetical protein
MKINIKLSLYFSFITYIFVSQSHSNTLINDLNVKIENLSLKNKVKVSANLKPFCFYRSGRKFLNLKKGSEVTFGDFIDQKYKTTSLHYTINNEGQAVIIYPDNVYPLRPLLVDKGGWIRKFLLKGRLFEAECTSNQEA